MNHDALRPVPGSARNSGLGGLDAGEHVADPAVVVQRQVDAEEERHYEDRDVLQYRRPGGSADTRDHHVSGEDDRADHDRDVRGDGAVRGLRDDDPETGQLEHQVGHHRDHADEGDEHSQVGAAVLGAEEVRLRHEPVLGAVPPDHRQQPVGHDVREGPVAEDVERRAALAVGPAASTEEGEGRVDLAGQQQEDEDRAESATAHRPLFEVHVPAPARAEPEQQRKEHDGEDDRQRCVHRGSPSRFTGSSE